MTPHPRQLAAWVEQLQEAAGRFARDREPLDAALVALLARNIERAAQDYLARFDLKGVIHGTQETR